MSFSYYMLLCKWFAMHTWVWNLQKSEESLGYPGTVDTDGCELPCEWWGPDPGLLQCCLQGCQVLLTTEHLTAHIIPVSLIKQSFHFAISHWDHKGFSFFHIENRFFSYNIFWLRFSLPRVFPVPSLLSKSTPFLFTYLTGSGLW